MERNNWMEALAAQHVTEELLKTNEKSREYGLTLSREEAQLIAAEQGRTLKEQKRMELGGGIAGVIIREFCDSAYLTQEEYAQTVMRLTEIFYLYKNEMEDEITDEELIHFMKEQFETVCCGDLEYLEGTCLALFAEAIRAGYEGHHESDGWGEYSRIDEVTRWDRELYLAALENLF